MDAEITESLERELTKGLEPEPINSISDIIIDTRKRAGFIIQETRACIKQAEIIIQQMETLLNAL